MPPHFRPTLWVLQPPIAHYKQEGAHGKRHAMAQRGYGSLLSQQRSEASDVAQGMALSGESTTAALLVLCVRWRCLLLLWYHLSGTLAVGVRIVDIESYTYSV